MKMLAKEEAKEEDERLAAERRLTRDKVTGDAQESDHACLKAEAEEKSQEEIDAKENTRLVEQHPLATEKRAEVAEAREQAKEQAPKEVQAHERADLKSEGEHRFEVEAHEKVLFAAEEEQQSEVRPQLEIHEITRLTAEENALLHFEEKVKVEEAASETIIEAASQEAKMKMSETQEPRDEIESVDDEELDPLLVKDDLLPKAREFSEPRPSPKKKVYTKRELISDLTPREQVTSPIRLQLVFGRGLTVKTIALVPQRRDGMPNNLEVMSPNGRLWLSEWSEDAYQPILLSKLPNSLSEGLVLQAHEGPRRWRWELTRREIYVLAAGDEFGLHGFVTRRIDQSLWLNTRHVILVKENLHDQVIAALAESGCSSPEFYDATMTGVPVGWILFYNVIPTRAVQMRNKRDILNVLCPAHEIEPKFVGGIRLERNIWLVGFPPRIRFNQELEDNFDILIDNQRTRIADDGAFEAPGWDNEGEHRLWFGGQAVTYVLHKMQENWSHWQAHDLGAGVMICGASTFHVDGAHWRQVRIPAENPLLLGAHPGEVFRCQSRNDVRAKTILTMVPFSPVWALPLNPVHADKRSARIVSLELIEPILGAEYSNRRSRMNDVVSWWVNVINGVSRKQLTFSTESDVTKVLWRHYRAVAKNIWRQTRKRR